MNATNNVRQERKSRRFWVLLIFGFFSLDIAIAVIAISMAAGDPSFRSIPGFGERAVAWDQRQSLKEAWNKQGWKIDIARVLPSMDAVEIVLKDSAGKPVSGCTGSVTMFHYTRVATQWKAAITEAQPGLYLAKIDVSKPGMWSLEIDMVTEDQEKCWFEKSFDWQGDSE
jgi:nitrogen fixation protein FixH